MNKSGHAKAVEAQIRSKMSNSNAQTVVWAFVEGVATAIDGSLGLAGIDSHGGAGISNSVIGLYRSASSSTSLLANPYFTGNGHGDNDASSATANYLKWRKYKSMASTVSGIGGGAASLVTVINVPSVGTNASAFGTTAVHFKQLADMARSSRKTGTVAQWLDLVARLKAIKLTKRSISIVGGTVPLPGLGMATGLIGTAMSTGVKLTLSKACVATALELHWRAYQEQFMSGTALGCGTGAVGPASKIVWELFTKRGISRILGKHDVNAIVKEPAGWMAISDKILLM